MKYEIIERVYDLSSAKELVERLISNGFHSSYIKYVYGNTIYYDVFTYEEE